MSVSVEVSVERSVLPLGESEIIVMASLECASTESEERKSRAPLDLCCVLDRSGSMAGEKLRLVQTAMTFVVEQLKEEDRLIIVLFDTKVQTILPLESMNKEGREKAKRAIEQATAGSSTNLSGGLFEGLVKMKERPQTRDVSSLLLFTDGLANVGLRSSEELVGAVKNVMSDMVPCPIYTFGFGDDHDPNMLRGIAEASNGLYYFLRKEDEIPQAFGECIGGLLSVAAQNVKVFLEVREGTEVLEALSTYNKVDAPELGGASVGLSLGDLFSEEHKDILFRLKVGSVSEPSTKEIGSMRVSYFDAMAGKLVEVRQVLVVRRDVECPSDSCTNPKIDVQRNRLRCASALREATKAGEDGNLERARVILRDTVEVIQRSATAEDAFCVALVHDLKQADEALSSKAMFKTEGHRYMSNMSCTHTMQRCTESAWDSKTPQLAQQLYTTSAKNTFRAMFSK